MLLLNVYMLICNYFIYVDVDKMLVFHYIPIYLRPVQFV